MYTLLVKQTFDAAHCIPDHPGKCRNLHGHTYRVEAEFSGTELNPIGMVQDFGDLKAVLKAVLPDHQYLNEVMPGPTTAEGISKWLFDQLAARGLPITALTVWETPDCGCRYTPEAAAR